MPSVIALNLIEPATVAINAIGGPIIEWEIAGLGGPPGRDATITIGTTTTGDPGTDAEVVNSGQPTDAVLDFTIPRGADGLAGTVTITDTITGAPGTDAEVVNTGTPEAAVLEFTIPRGDQGDSGGFWRHIQPTPATSWVVTHALGYRPNVSIEDSAGEVWIPSGVQHIDDLSLRVDFDIPFSGYANCS